MDRPSQRLSDLLRMIVEHIDVPKSYYEKAAARHRSLGEWLHRKESTLVDFDPDVRPQGSFRYGVVTRPLDEDCEYDLDNVCVLKKLAKSDLTQEQLKQLYGEEIKAYSKANGMIAPAEEHNRCWRLRYADEVSFHLDSLPCVPEEEQIVSRITQMGVPLELARRAIAITDRRHQNYRELTSLWLSSNPRGFAAWFEGRAALGRQRALSERQIRAVIEDVPPYEWKTALQRTIQLLKRHRDVMFRENPECAPISMIITNLAANAYSGETDLTIALHNIVLKMTDYVRLTAPRIPNPADPAEDYADKWSKDPRLEKNFWEWHYALKSDLAWLQAEHGGMKLRRQIEKMFDVTLTEQELRTLGVEVPSALPISPTASPVLILPSAPKPWGANG